MDSDSDMEQFLDSDTETSESDVETIEITETSESDVETIENTDSYLKISVRVEHGKIQKPRTRNWKTFRRNNKRVAATGVNSKGNYYTVWAATYILICSKRRFLTRYKLYRIIEREDQWCSTINMLLESTNRGVLRFKNLMHIGRIIICVIKLDFC